MNVPHTAFLAHVAIPGWYAITTSRAVKPNRPLAVERLGRRLVVWRAERGIVVQDARCPHRGADLGLGRVAGGELACGYHGFRFRADGSCAAVPCEGSGYAPPRELRLECYHAVERAGIVWLWHPDAGQPDSDVPPWFASVPEGLARSASAEMTWRAPFERVIEGMLDIHHAPFAHRRVMPGVGARLDPFDVELLADGRTIHAHGRLRKEHEPADGKHGLAFDLRFRFPCLLLGEFFGMQLVVAVTPIDHERTYILYRYVSRTPIIGGLLAWIAVVSEDRLVQVDDQRLQESTRPLPFDRRANCYVPADAAFLLWHKLYRQARRAHLAIAG